MGFRFRQRIKIAPGIYINLGKKGVNSASFRAGPFTTNVNKDGVRHTAGLHGSGLSYETKRSSWGGESGGASPTKKFLIIAAVLFTLYLIIH